MPVTVILEQHKPQAQPMLEHAKSREHFLERSCPYEFSSGQAGVVTSSFFQNPQVREKIYPSSSSVVRSAIEAWARHSHLVLRPDDFWLQILVQMNFFMEKNGESLRHIFVSHDGQEEIEIIDDSWETIVERFEVELQEKVKTPWLAEWVSPGFSTTRSEDRLAAIVLMMGLMSTFFEYSADDICGIPSITLQGTKADWERLLVKIDRLTDFGNEPTNYQKRLRPILTRIVRTFDEPSSAATNEFWDQLVHSKVKHSRVCGMPPLQYNISGWILGFFFWNSSGDASKRFSQGLGVESQPGAILLDGIRYGEEFLENLPVGYGRVTLKKPKANGQSEEDRWKGWLVAGSMGKRIFDGAPPGYFNASSQSQDTLDPPRTSDEASSEGNILSTGKGGRFTRIAKGLGCFCGAEDGREEEGVRANRPMQERKHVPASHVVPAMDVHTADGHSTIQPCSGWALFGPQKELGPFIEGEEVDGPTVDAIESCNGIEHYGNGAPTDRSTTAELGRQPEWFHLPPIKP